MISDISSGHCKTETLNLKKTSQACDRCHKRRIKCQFDPSIGRCLNCHKLLQNCTFHRIPQKRGPHRKKRIVTKSINFKSPYFSIIDNRTALNLSRANITENRIDKGNNTAYMRTDSVISNPENVENITYIIDEQQQLEVGNRVSHSLLSILEIYYNDIHKDLSIFPLDSFSQFQNIILNNIQEKKLITIFHSILETMFYGDELEKVKGWKRLWYQLVTTDYIETVTDYILYLICHFLICIMVPINAKVLGHCIGTYYEIYKEIPVDINVRLRGVIQLLNLLNQKFNNMESMFSMFTSNNNEICLMQNNISEITTILTNENDLESLNLESFKNIYPIWLEYCRVKQRRTQLINAIQNDKIDFEDIVNRLCCLIRSMLDLLINIDNGKYTNSIFQILKNKDKNEYKYEFGLKLIVNKTRQLLDIIKDTPSLLITMTLYSNPNNTDKAFRITTTNTTLMVNQLSNSMNELVQITTLTNKLGGDDYRTNYNNYYYSNNNNNNSLSYILCKDQELHSNIHNDTELLKTKPTSPSLSNLIDNSDSRNRNAVFKPSLKNLDTNTSMPNQDISLHKLNQISKILQATG